MNGRNRQRIRQNGFTLAEVLFASAIGAFVLTGVLTSYVFALKGFQKLSNYNEIQTDGRRAGDWIARDVWASMAIASCTSNQLIVVIPTTIGSDGHVTASNLVTHLYQGGSWYRIDGNTGESTLLAENVAQLTFTLFNSSGTVTTQTSPAVSVQIDALLKKNVMGNDQTMDFLSARLRMRNAS